MIKKFLPFEKYTLITPLSITEVKKRIADNVEPKRTALLKIINRRYTKPYEGQVNDSHFKINRIIQYRNSFLPIITGNISTHHDQTKIDINMQPITFVLVFMSFWLGGIGLVCVGVFFGGILNIRTIMETGLSPALFLPFGMFIFGLLLITLGFKHESNKSKKFLLDLFEATELEIDNQLKMTRNNKPKAIN